MAKIYGLRHNARTDAIVESRMQHSRAMSDAVHTALDRYDLLCASERAKARLSFAQLLVVRKIAQAHGTAPWMYLVGRDTVSEKDFAAINRVCAKADDSLGFKLAMLDGFEQLDILLAKTGADMDQAREISGRIFPVYATNVEKSPD